MKVCDQLRKLLHYTNWCTVHCKFRWIVEALMCNLAYSPSGTSWFYKGSDQVQFFCLGVYSGTQIARSLVCAVRVGMDLIGGMVWEAEGKVFDGGLVEVLHFGEDGVMLVMINYYPFKIWQSAWVGRHYKSRTCQACWNCELLESCSLGRRFDGQHGVEEVVQHVWVFCAFVGLWMVNIGNNNARQSLGELQGT